MFGGRGDIFLRAENQREPIASRRGGSADCFIVRKFVSIHHRRYVRRYEVCD